MSHPVGIEANLHAILDSLEWSGDEHPVGIEANLHAILDRTGETIHKTDELEQKKADMIVSSASGSIASITDGAEDMPVQTLKVGIEPVQDLHSYDAPWPAGGGKNLLNAPDITLTEAGTVYSGAISLAAGTYTLSSSNTTVSVTVGETSGVMPLTFTCAEAISSIEITASGEGTFNNLQIESGSSATTYAPYSNICPISGWTGVTVTRTGEDQGDSTTYHITFPTEAGTVYGGQLTVQDDGTGELVVDRAVIASYNSESLSGEWISDRDVYASGTTPTTGAQVVYKLATPITYQLTDLEVIKLLKGTNNIWADTGDTEATYRADTKLYIDNKITQAIAAALNS